MSFFTEAMLSYANDALRPHQFNQIVDDRATCVALSVGLVVAQVADVALIVRGSAMGLAVGVD